MTPAGSFSHNENILLWSLHGSFFLVLLACLAAGRESHPSPQLGAFLGEGESTCQVVIIMVLALGLGSLGSA